MKKTLILSIQIFVSPLIFCQISGNDAPPPPPPPPPKPSINDINISRLDYTFFPGCEDIKDLAEKRKCADEKMNTYLTESAKSKMREQIKQDHEFLKERRKLSSQDTVWVSFIVERNGSVSNPCVTNSLNASYNSLAIEILEEMPHWRRNGRHPPVRKKLNVPIVFELSPNPPPPPPPPPIRKPHPCDTLWRDYPTMPLFPACQELISNRRMHKECADGKMLDFIDEHLIYPDAARKDSITGMVVVRFVVHENGELTDMEVVRNKLGEAFGEAALEVVKKMPNWIPGRRCRGPVKVQFNLPVRFGL